jgi:hypothetical protein
MATARNEIDFNGRARPLDAPFRRVEDAPPYLATINPFDCRINNHTHEIRQFSISRGLHPPKHPLEIWNIAFTCHAERWTYRTVFWIDFPISLANILIYYA